NFQHFPDNEAWELGEGFKNKKDFYALPIVKRAAVDFNVTSFIPSTGHIAAKTDKAVEFNFSASGSEQITSVALAIGDDRSRKIKPMNYTATGSGISFSYKFADEDSFPVTI